MRRIGVLTSGGDCPGLNAVIRAAVRTADEVYRAEVIGIPDGFSGLLPGGCPRLLSSDDVSGLLVMGGTMLGTTNRGPFNLGPDGLPAPVNLSEFESASARAMELGLEGLIVVGGDGSLRIAKAFQRTLRPEDGSSRRWQLAQPASQCPHCRPCTALDCPLATPHGHRRQTTTCCPSTFDGHLVGGPARSTSKSWATTQVATPGRALSSLPLTMQEFAHVDRRGLNASQLRPLLG